MSFLPDLPESAYAWPIRLVFKNHRKRFGQILEPVKLWGRIPKTFVTFQAMLKTLDRKNSPIEPTLRALLMVRISQLNWCAFCVDLNSLRAIQAGAAMDKLDALPQYETSPLFNERERAALAYADAMTNIGQKVDESQVQRLRAAGYDDQAIVELAALCAFQNMSAKFNAGLGVPAQGLCKVPGTPQPE